jgi:hypothetical protein
VLKVRLTEDVPAEFVAEIVYTVAGVTTVGTPEIAPVLGSKVSPVGSAGLIA